MIVPAVGLSKDGNRWSRASPGSFLHVRVLSGLFRRCLSKVAGFCIGERENQTSLVI